MKSSKLRLLPILALLILIMPLRSWAQVYFGVEAMPDQTTYTVKMRPLITWTFPFNLTGTAQITLRVPHAEGADRFTTDNLTSMIAGSGWVINGRADAPLENPGYDYISFGLSTLGVELPFTANVETVLFSFQNNGACLGAIEVIDNDTDPLNIPNNSTGTSVANQITTFGAGNIDAYAGVYVAGSNDCSDFFPIELLSFEALPTNGRVDLSWTTATEINNDFFTVERSIDGRNFEQILTMKGAGTTQTVQYYETSDLHPYTGISLYRLKQTDFDGSFSYSEIVEVYLDPGTIQLKAMIFPNPLASNTVLQIQFDAAAQENFILEVTNQHGQIMYQQQLQSVIGINHREVSNTDWAAGLYQLRLFNENQSAVFKLVLE